MFRDCQRRLVAIVAAATMGIGVLYSFPTSATADDYEPQPLELAPRSTVSCDWSKLSASEFADCKRRQEHYESQTPAERVKQNIEARRNRAASAVVVGGDRRALGHGKRGH